MLVFDITRSSGRRWRRSAAPGADLARRAMQPARGARDGARCSRCHAQRGRSPRQSRRHGDARRVVDALEAVRGVASNAAAVRRGASVRAQLARVGRGVADVWVVQQHREAEATRSPPASLEDVREAVRSAWYAHERLVAADHTRRGQRDRVLRLGGLFGASFPRAAATPRNLVPLPSWCEEPTFLQQHWIHASLLALLTSKAFFLVSGNMPAILEAYRAGIELVSTRLTSNVYEPLMYCSSYIFGRKLTPGGGAEGSMAKAVSYEDGYRKVSFLYALLLLVARLTRRQPVDLTEEVFRAKMALVKIDRHLLSVKAGIGRPIDTRGINAHVSDARNAGDNSAEARGASCMTSLEETGTCIFLTAEVFREVNFLYTRSGSGRGGVHRVRDIVTDGASDYTKSASSINPLEYVEMRKHLALLSWPGLAVDDRLRIVETIRTSFGIFH